MTVVNAQAGDTRLSVDWSGVGVTLGMLVAGAVVAVVQSRIASSSAGQPISGAIEATVDAVLTSLNQFIFIGFIVAAIIALIGREREVSPTDGCS